MIPAAEALARIEALPLLRFEALFADRPILVLAPHQDDESLGCGGLLAEAAARGVPAQVVFLTDGGMSHPNSRAWPRARLITERRAEALRALAALGVPPERASFLDQPDSEAPHAGPEFDRALEQLCQTMRYHDVGTIVASWSGDPHGDHGAASKLAGAAARRTGARHLAYPVWAWTVPAGDMLPEVAGGGRLDVSAHLPAKRRAIAAHATQHGRVVTDDPSGFTLPDSFLALFDRPWEAFLEQP